ncbi:archaetidylserine decarboxylase [Vibrio sp. DW001]|uniref:archaetidylserine decarboxylase n=1 Tax=Vibrio sp. DW001 TaxID=2912315 RepID=UPI0023B1D1F0|nr:archaetidylserine decarboxylase [Vibrio sp. DW001]WED26929.1 archaetidylserine decarboxylase [Vibrio sp. DW001]
MTLSDKIKIWFQLWAPKHAITRVVGKLASAKLGRVTTALITMFIKQYKINMDEALHSDPAYFKTFNDFFVRELKTDARILNDDTQVITHPADACVSQFGPIENGQIIQAKSHNFSALELLGGDTTLYDEFEDGSFATLYLSPSDYHRVHMPCDGVLRKMIYVPGDLYSVNPLTAENIPNLFARNERVVCIFDTKFGPLAQVLVGATIVGSIELIWAGTVTPPRGNTVYCWDYPANGNTSVVLKKGDEMGRFKLGSTVINLFSKDAIDFDASMDNGVSTKLGTAYANIK